MHNAVDVLPSNVIDEASNSGNFAETPQTNKINPETKAMVDGFNSAGLSETNILSPVKQNTPTVNTNTFIENMYTDENVATSGLSGKSARISGNPKKPTYPKAPATAATLPRALVLS